MPWASHPNILVNNASFFGRATLDEISADAFDHAMAVNVRAPMLLAQGNEPTLSACLAPDGVGKIFNINDRRQVYRNPNHSGRSTPLLTPR